MSKLDRICRTLLDEQELLDSGSRLTKFRLGNFKKRYDEIQEDIRLAKAVREKCIDTPDHLADCSTCPVLVDMINEAKR